MIFPRKPWFAAYLALWMTTLSVIALTDWPWYGWVLSWVPIITMATFTAPEKREMVWAEVSMRCDCHRCQPQGDPDRPDDVY